MKILMTGSHGLIGSALVAALQRTGAQVVRLHRSGGKNDRENVYWDLTSSVGDVSGALAKMLPLFRLGLGGRLGRGTQYWSWIALLDVVSAIDHILRTPALTGPINLTSPAPVTNRDFTATLGRVLHRPARLAVPAFGLRLALGEMADEALLASARVQPRRLLESGFVFQYPTLDQALEAGGGFGDKRSGQGVRRSCWGGKRMPLSSVGDCQPGVNHVHSAPGAEILRAVGMNTLLVQDDSSALPSERASKSVGTS